MAYFIVHLECYKVLFMGPSAGALGEKQGFVLYNF